jgi:predicted O-methyltransferase YrrM
MLASFLRRLIPERFRPIGYLTHLARERTGSTVAAGPFVGLKYGGVSQGSAYIPKLLGIYERELTPQVAEIVSLHPRLIVDIGAAEGYYAVGLARLLPEARVIGFEMEASGREALSAMAARNAVAERVEVRGKCEPHDLVAALGHEDSAVVICDVEGYEEVLLDPAAVPRLANAAILVELHDFLVPGLRETIRERFAASHEITLITQEPRTRQDFPWRTLGTALLPNAYLDWAVSEWRPVVMEWYWMVPKR